MPVNEEIAMRENGVEISLDVESARHVRLGDHEPVECRHRVEATLVTRDNREFRLSAAKYVLSSVGSAYGEARSSLRAVVLLVPLLELRDNLVDSRAHRLLHWVRSPSLQACKIVSNGYPARAT